MHLLIDIPSSKIVQRKPPPNSLINLPATNEQTYEKQNSVKRETRIPFAIYKQSMFLLSENDDKKSLNTTTWHRKEHLTHEKKPQIDLICCKIFHRIHLLCCLSRFDTNKCPKMIASTTWAQKEVTHEKKDTQQKHKQKVQHIKNLFDEKHHPC